MANKPTTKSKELLDPKYFNTSEKIVITEEEKCYFCSETRRLHRAHIIPAAIFRAVEYEGVDVPQLNHTLLMCPTHHYCYDHYELAPEEKEMLQPILDKYTEVFTKLLKSIEVRIPARGIDGMQDGRFILGLEHMLNHAWKWWRVYAIK